MKKQPMNWIEGMGIEMKQKRRKMLLINVFVWILILSGCILSWVGFYKLVLWAIR